jgi:hypothetical protein
MRRSKRFGIILAISLVIAMLIYVIDTGGSIPVAIVNVFEVLLMTGILFASIAINYSIISTYVAVLSETPPKDQS